MAEEQSQVGLQSTEATLQETSSANTGTTTNTVNTTEEQSQSQLQSRPSQSQGQSQAVSAETTTPPQAQAAPGEPAAPASPEPPVQKEPPKEPAAAPPAPVEKGQRHSLQADHVRDRKSTHRATYGTRSTRDFRAFSRAGYMSMMSIKRGSLASFQDRQKQPKYMNTYKLHSEKPFNPDKVKSIIVKVVEENLSDDTVYDVSACPDKAKHISATIRQKVKEQEFDRYKLVCIVTIGEKKSHDVLTAVRFLWDSERDRYATHFYENMYLFAVASVFGLYYE